MARQLSSTLRGLIVERAGGACEYCLSQERFSPDSFSIEHIQPLARGGQDTIDNLAFACQGCNNRKYVSTTALDPATGKSVTLFQPRVDLWLEHFAWNEDCSVMIGLTPTGRATIAKLQLNRSGIVNLRKILFLLGLHPPT
jgi:hypothetical protein